MKLRCAITDDEPLALDLMESYVNKTPSLILAGRYSSAVEALGSLRENPVDLLFLDIQMPELSGIELSRIIDPATRIVFTTAFGSYALDGFKVNALDYLLKPITYQDFLQSVDKALKWFSLVNKAAGDPRENAKDPGERESIFVKSEYKLLQIRLDDIIYVEGLKDYIKIYTETSREPVLSLMSMKSMEDMLPAERFIRVHRSFIVQKSKIQVIERSRIIFGDKYIPIGDNYKESFLAFIDGMR